VRIDTARDDEFAGSIDRVVGFHLEVSANDGNTLVFDQNIGFVVIDRSHDAAILD
jgi:hypothetical protein